MDVTHAPPARSRPERRPIAVHEIDRKELFRKSLRRDIIAAATVVGLVGIVVPLVLGLPLAFSAAVPAAMLVFVLVLRSPRMAILAVMVVRTAIDVLWFTEGSIAGVTLTQAGSGALVAVLLVIVFLRRDVLFSHPMILPLFLYGLFSSISMVFSPELLSVANAAARLGGTITLCALATTYFDTRDRARTLVGVMMLSGLLPNVIGLYYYATNQGMVEIDNLTRAFGAYSNLHNTAHGTAAFAAVSWFFVYTEGRSRGGAVAAAIGVMSLASLYLTLVRTPMIGLGVQFLIFTLLERRFVLMGAGVGAASAAWVYNATFRGRFLEFAEIFSDGGGLRAGLGSGRWGLWTEVISNFVQKPFYNLVFGVGLNQQVNLNALHWDTHNDYLGLLTQAGPFALLAYLVCQGMLFLTAFRLARMTSDTWTRQFAHFMIAYDVAVTVMNVISNSYTSRLHIQWFFWTLAGVVFGLYAAEVRKRRAVPAAAPAGAPEVAAVH